VLGAIRHGAVAREGDDVWERVVIAYYPPDRTVEGLTVAAVAERDGREPEAVVLGLAEGSSGRAEIINYCMSQDEVDEVAALPFAAVASDGYALGAAGPDGSLPHPRSFGTFPRFLRRYVRELGVLTLPDAIRKMTSMPARLVGLDAVGSLEPGKRADIVVFGLDRVADAATFEQPSLLPEGIDAVVLGGRLMEVDEQGVRTPVGEALRGR
jgi:N-acyl-D-amino-acid deacylase